MKVVCQASQAHPQHTVLEGEALTRSVAGEKSSFTVTLFDIGNNQLPKGGDTLNVAITPENAKIEVFDLNNGVYRVEYLIDQVDTYSLEVVTNYAASEKMTSVIVVEPAGESMQTSTITFAAEVDVASE